MFRHFPFERFHHLIVSFDQESLKGKNDFIKAQLWRKEGLWWNIYVFQVTKPYVTFILSLLISDSFTALLLGIQLLFGAYLPVVHKIHLHGCIMTVSEAFKLAGVLVTVYHLLVMVTMHLLGVTAPISFKKVRSKLFLFKNAHFFHIHILISGPHLPFPLRSRFFLEISFLLGDDSAPGQKLSNFPLAFTIRIDFGYIFGLSKTRLFVRELWRPRIFDEAALQSRLQHYDSNTDGR